MDLMNYTIEDQKQIFSNPVDSPATTITEPRGMVGAEGAFATLAGTLAGRSGDLHRLYQETLHADIAPASIDTDPMSYRMNGSELTNIDENQFLGTSRTDTASLPASLFDDGSIGGLSRNGDMLDTFDFLVKSLTSANNFVSMLNREQLQVLRAIRPGLLYEFLQEVANVRSDKRMRRALPNECAFCKNNGENEECYSSHALKDWRGRVLCPVLRAFRCPRCGATGDRAHTIKYCPDNNGDRDGLSRRRGSASSLSLSAAAGAGALRPPPTPSPSPAPHTASLPHSSLWSSLGIN